MCYKLLVKSKFELNRLLNNIAQIAYNNLLKKILFLIGKLFVNNI